MARKSRRQTMTYKKFTHVPKHVMVMALKGAVSQPGTIMGLSGFQGSSLVQHLGDGRIK